MKYSTSRLNILCLLGLCLLLFKTEPIEAQNKRTSRVTSSRSFGTNVKTDNSNGPSFDCPEEFGYYPHPSDCTQYYVCVFGGALLESCTGGLMYSHDLQTCDWPRNVGCELADTSSERNIAQSQVQRQREPHAQHVPSRIRFGAAFSSQGGTQKTATVPPQYHRSPPQVIQAQVQNIPPPPPELRVSPNPVITSRGQPKPLIDSQEDIAKLYADAQESLPPVEEEESDRQQRVYRGQPSTVSQVQRDRDGIIHQASINSIPQTGKIGSYAFGTAYSKSLQDDQTLELSYNRLDESRRRKRRDLSAQPTKVTEEKYHNDTNCSREVLEHASPTELSDSTETSKTSQERLNDGAPANGRMRKYSSKIRQLKSENAMEFDYKEIPGEDSQLMDGYEDEDDVATGESKRRPRQLRPISHTSLKWPVQNYRAIDSPPLPQVSQQTGYSFGSYNPYLTPPNTNPVHNQQPYGNPNYNHLPGYHSYVHQQHQLASAGPLSQKKHKLPYTGYNLSLPPPPLEDDFRPIAGSYYEAAGAAQTSPRSPNSKQHHSNAGDLLPYLIQQLKELKEQRKHLQSDNFAYFRLDNQPMSPVPTQAVTPVPTISTTYYSPVDASKLSQQVTPNGQYSTMGGFYNNQKPGKASFNPNYPGKLVSQYSIASNGHDSTTESNYFQYNIVANQKMKGVFSTAPPNQIGHSAVKVRPPVTPLQVTQSINVVSAPNLTYKIPNGLQQAPFALLPEGISYASNSTIPESYQTFTKSVSTSATVLSDVPTTTPKSKLTNFQFNINEFMANLKESDLSSVNPAVNPLIKYFKELSTDNNGNINLPNPLVNRRPVTGSTSTLNSTTTTTQVDIKPNTPAYKKRIKPDPTLPTQSTPTPIRILKGYEHFIKGIQNQLNSRNSSQSTVYNTSTTLIRMPTTTTIKSVDYYDEDYEEDEDILPPSQMPPYMPVSETMAPPRRHLATARPNTESPGKGPASFQTGFLEATTTRRPFPTFTQVNQAGAEADVPSFISFPSDIFQELKQRLPKLPEPNAPQSSTKVFTTPRSVRPTSHPRPISSSTEQQPTRIEQDNTYDQPTRSPQRAEHVAIQKLDTRASHSSTVTLTTTASPPEVLTYYETLTTPYAPKRGSSDYAYGSAEDNDQRDRLLTEVKSRPHTGSEDFDLIANVVGHTDKNTATPPTRSQKTKSTPPHNGSQKPGRSSNTTTHAVTFTQSSTITTTSTFPPTTTKKLTRESPNRVTANPAMHFVSPYKSLENLLHEDRQHHHHQLRTTTRPRYTNAPAFSEFLQTTAKSRKNLFMMASVRNSSKDVLATMETGNARNFSVSDAILSTFSPQRPAPSMLRTTTTTTTTTTMKPPPIEITSTEDSTTVSAIIASSAIHISQSPKPARGRSRYTAATLNSLGDSGDEPTTYAPKLRLLGGYDPIPLPKTKPQRVQVIGNQRSLLGGPTSKPHEKYRALEDTFQAKDLSIGSKNQTAEHTLADSLQNSGYITSPNGSSQKFRSPNVLEQLRQFLSGSDSNSNSDETTPSSFAPHTARASRVNNDIKSSIAAAALGPSTSTYQPSVSAGKTQKFQIGFATNNKNHQLQKTSINHNGPAASASVKCSDSTLNAKCNEISSRNNNRNRGSAMYSNQDRDLISTPNRGTHPPRTRPTLKPSGIIVSKAQEFVDIYRYPPSRPDPIYPQPTPDKTAAKCRKDVCLLPDCYCGGKDIPGGLNASETPQFVLMTFDDAVNTINIDLYEELFNNKSRKNPNGCSWRGTFYLSHEWTDYVMVQDLYSQGHEMASHTVSIPQIVLLTFDDSVNDLNKQLYTDLFEKGRVNPNGCPITATFYVSHEWTDYSQVQNLYADGHEMASHTVSHSFGEQFSQKKWTREIAGQREILAAYGGVKMSDVRGMRAPFLSVGGNKMYKMLYDSNFTYDSSMPVYENRPPSWPYTLDYKIFHDCMIPPCPTRSYPGVWQVPMVMWQDLNGGRCSMGDACSNPSDADGVTKMIMKNFERHYTTNRAPFGLFYHAAWFTQPHHKEGFIKFLDAINAMQDVWIITNWQALQWVRDPTPISRINSFQPFQCDYSDRPKRCNNPKVCNLWHKSGVRYMKTCQPCPDIYPWTGKSGIRSSRIDNEVEEPAA
ncbi:GD22994 [Drosophila simulans]|uniref:GD22994 n=1 Tax=Drosophila simulans TaxID=7240 RepID=B4Q5L2_DROSI|nr:GD22994 [Drosophila simulans]